MSNHLSDLLSQLVVVIQLTACMEPVGCFRSTQLRVVYTTVGNGIPFVLFPLLWVCHSPHTVLDTLEWCHLLRGEGTTRLSLLGSWLLLHSDSLVHQELDSRGISYYYTTHTHTLASCTHHLQEFSQKHLLRMDHFQEKYLPPQTLGNLYTSPNLQWVIVSTKFLSIYSQV